MIIHDDPSNDVRAYIHTYIHTYACFLFHVRWLRKGRAFQTLKASLPLGSRGRAFHKRQSKRRSAQRAWPSCDAQVKAFPVTRVFVKLQAEVYSDSCARCSFSRSSLRHRAVTCSPRVISKARKEFLYKSWNGGTRFVVLVFFFSFSMQISAPLCFKQRAIYFLVY